MDVGGYTCDDVNSVIDAHLATYKPKKVVIVCGENDLWGQNVARTFGDFKVVIDKIIALGASALHLGTKPEPSTTLLWEKYQQYERSQPMNQRASSTYRDRCTCGVCRSW